MASLDWVDWFNHRRLLEPISNVLPVKAEARYYQQLPELYMATWLKPTRSPGNPARFVSVILFVHYAIRQPGPKVINNRAKSRKCISDVSFVVVVMCISRGRPCDGTRGHL
jgi:hypothetical protein